MKPALRHAAGFTIIELALVLLVVGLLASALIPLAHDVHDTSLRDTDEARMNGVKDALLGYIRITREIPCVDASGVDASTGCDATNTLSQLGVRLSDSRNKRFVFDVNDTLTANAIALSGDSICTALAHIINPALPPASPPEPNVCDSANANTGAAACTASNPMAFVLVGRGSDRCLNLENTHGTAPNDPVCATAAASNRTFENPARRRSREVDDGYYDDLVVTVTPSELAEVLKCPAGGGGSGNSFYCGSGETLVNVVNGTENFLSVAIGGASCYLSWKGSTSGAGCQPDGQTISIHTNAACGGSGVIGPSTLDALDTNDDGRVDVLCDKNDNCSAR